MSDSQTSAHSTPAWLTAEAVEAWLTEHPAFFKGRESLLAEMHLDHPCGDAESLLLYQLRLLRREQAEQRKQYRQLLNTARDNEHRLRRVERLVLALLDTPDPCELFQALQASLRDDFRIPEARLFTYQPIPGLPQLDERSAGAQLALLGSSEATSIALDEFNAPLLDMTQLAGGSALMCRLGEPALGMLILAHPRPSQFNHQQDTLFVEYLGHIIHRLLHRQQEGRHR